MSYVLKDYLFEKEVYTESLEANIEKMDKMIEELEELQKIERMMTELDFKDWDEMNDRLDTAKMNIYSYEARIKTCEEAIADLDKKIEQLEENNRNE